jgi:predicted dehydrogenase
MGNKDGKTRIGIIGCGNISSAYIIGCRQFDHLTIEAVTDLVPEVAHSKAAEHDITRVLSVEQLLADPVIDIVINLTIPDAHAPVSLAAIKAGKHIYSEKPLAITREDGRAILDAADQRGVRVGCAPDTFLGGGLQTCRKLIDDGAIGVPVAATAFFLGHGPEAWHPNPAFFYRRGAGPLLDIGPYYITSLIHLLGPVERVAAMARVSFPERTATSPARYGEKLPVEVPTHVAGTLAMTSGAIATLITSFDVWGHNLPRIEIHGSEGSLSVPDPNIFGGPVRLLRAGEKEWEEMSLTHSDTVRRGVGVADMAAAIRDGRPHRASGELAYHALDVMHALYDSSAEKKQVWLQSACARPEAAPVGAPEGFAPERDDSLP